MSGETPFRVAVAAVMILTMVITAWHRWQAAAGGENVSRGPEGLLFAVVLRLSGLLLLLATLTYVVQPAPVLWSRIPLPVSLRWAAITGGLAGAMMMYWTLQSLGRNLTDTVTVRTHAILVTHGPYRWVRHPFYVTTALLMLSVTIISANAVIGALSVLVLALLAVRTPQEEQMLVERFGQSYQDYMSRTGRFWPRTMPFSRRP